MARGRGLVCVCLLAGCVRGQGASDVPAPAPSGSGLPALPAGPVASPAPLTTVTPLARACVPGQSIACAGVAACTGYQVCRPDGQSYAACNCAPPRVVRPPDPPPLPPPPPAAAPDAGAAPCTPGNCTVAFASDASWSSFAGTRSQEGASYSKGALLGPARYVCANDATPANCPAGALLYKHLPPRRSPLDEDNPPASQGWRGNRDFPEAYWIWRADVLPAAAAPFAVVVLEKSFVLGARPSGTMQIAVDDFAQVFVNHTSVGSLGSVVYVSVAWKAQNEPTVLDLTPALHAGSNTITVVAQNGPFACDAAQCPYSQDPAGVVFDGTFRW